MTPLQRGSILGSLLGIVLCGGLGGLAAWAVVMAIGVNGVFGAILATVIGMVVAAAAWTACTSLMRTLRRAR
jgi:hypothetical protein